jgi:hypothetical protein
VQARPSVDPRPGRGSWRIALVVASLGLVGPREARAGTPIPIYPIETTSTATAGGGPERPEPEPVAPAPVAPAAVPAAAEAPPALPGPPEPPPEPPPRIEVEGNVVLIDAVYQAVVDLPPGTPVNPRTAEYVERTLNDFMRRAGYDLAIVHAESRGDHIHVQIDEGQLDQVVFPGEGVLPAIRIRLLLVLPNNVFNRYLIADQIAEVARVLGYERGWYELVPVEQPDHGGYQIEDLGKLRGVELIPKPHAYSLHIHFQKREWSVGLGIDVALRSPDGLRTGLRYRDERLMFDDDRWSVRGSVTTRVQDILGDAKGQRALSGADLDVKYWSPELLEDLRPMLWLATRYVSRQRLDLNIRKYDLLTFQPAFVVAANPAREVIFSLGVGADLRTVLAVDVDGTPVPRRDPLKKVRPFVTFQLELIIDPDDPRVDRRHQAEFEARHYAGGDDPSLTDLFVEYQKVWLLGWDEMWLQAKAASLFGLAAYPDELRVSQFIRGISEDTLFTRRAASAAFQYRVSLIRDLFKIGIYLDGAVYQRALDPDEPRSIEAAGTVGLGVHALVIETFQMDLWLAGGFASDHGADLTFTAALRQAY